MPGERPGYLSVAKSNPMPAVYAKLERAGFAQRYVRDVVLPEWWDDEAATADAALAEALLTIAQLTGLDYSSLRGEAEAQPAVPEGVRFKRAQSVAESDLLVCSNVALRTAALAALCVSDGELSVPLSAAAVRNEILARGEPWVSLETIVDACWAAGIPVIHLSQLPPKAKKMDGMSAMVQGRPVIVVTRQNRASAWLAFIVAHELGHIVLGHLKENEAIVDNDVADLADDEEQQANRFALELLCGDPRARLTTSQRWPKAPELAAHAKEFGQRNQIDPGHVVLNFGKSMDLFNIACAALNCIEPNADAPGLIRRKMMERLDWTALPPDAARFLIRIADAEDDAAA